MILLPLKDAFSIKSAEKLQYCRKDFVASTEKKSDVSHCAKFKPINFDSSKITFCTRHFLRLTRLKLHSLKIQFHKPARSKEQSVKLHFSKTQLEKLYSTNDLFEKSSALKVSPSLFVEISVFML